MAMNNEQNIENLFIVRRYSEIVRDDMPNEPLSQGLAVKVDSDAEHERKGKYYMEEALTGLLGEVGGDFQDYDNLAITKLAELEVKSKELEAVWAKFADKLKLADDSHPVAKDKEPDMNIAWLAIQKAQAEIKRNKDSKFGKVKAFFGMSAQVLDNHNYLFDMLPTGDKYTSVFTGAFAAMVKATITHDKIAIEISDSLDEISHQVRSFYYVVRFHQTSTYIRYHIALFYFEVFGFLICVMREWYQSSWKRLSRSLGNSFLENTVRGTIRTLTQYTKRIKDEEDRRAKEMNFRQLCALGAMVQDLLVGQAKDHKAIKALHRKIETAGSMGPPPLPNYSRVAASQDQGQPTLCPNSVTIWSRDTILTDTNHLEPYLQTAHNIKKLIDLSHSIEVKTEVSIRIHKWVMNTSSEVLWIEGPAGFPYPSQSTLISSFMLKILRQTKVPVMVDFIQYNPRYTWDPEKEFLKTIYTLIYQAARAIPESFEPQLTDIDFSSRRFEKLKGDVSTLPDALTLLADLLAIGPALQFCIIDGLQFFGGRHMSMLVKNSMRDFVTLLCKAVGDRKAKGEGKESVMKVLFTTEGFVAELANSAGKRQLIRESYESESEDEFLVF